MDNQFKAGFMRSRLKVEDASGGSELAFTHQSDRTVRSFPLPSTETISKLKELLDITEGPKGCYKGCIPTREFTFDFDAVHRYSLFPHDFFVKLRVLFHCILRDLSSLLMCAITRVADNRLFLLYLSKI